MGTSSPDIGKIGLVRPVNFATTGVTLDAGPSVVKGSGDRHDPR
jgi:hypothetical protein